MSQWPSERMWVVAGLCSGYDSSACTGPAVTLRDLRSQGRFLSAPSVQAAQAQDPQEQGSPGPESLCSMNELPGQTSLGRASAPPLDVTWQKQSCLIRSDHRSKQSCRWLVPENGNLQSPALPPAITGSEVTATEKETRSLSLFP